MVFEQPATPVGPTKGHLMSNNTTHGHTISAAAGRTRRAIVATAILSAGLAVVAGQALTGQDAAAGSVPATSYAAVEIPAELRAAMHANGLAGLSPASAAPIDQGSATQGQPSFRDGWMASTIAVNASVEAASAADVSEKSDSAA